MSRRDIEEHAHSAAASARAWASKEAQVGADAALESVRSAAGFAPTPTAGPSNRRVPVLLGAAAVVVALMGAAVYVGGGSDNDRLVPVDTVVVDSTIADSIDDTVTETPASPVTTSAPDEAVVVDPDAPPVPRTFAIDFEDIAVQDTFPMSSAELPVGSDIEELGRDGRSSPLAPSVVGEDDFVFAEAEFVVADAVNGRVQIIDPYALEASRDEFVGEEGPRRELVPAVSLPILADTDLEPANILVGQPIVGPKGEQIIVPVLPQLPTSDFTLSLHRFERDDDRSWEFAEAVVPDFALLGVDDEFVVEGRSLVHVASGNVVYDFELGARFAPIVREQADGWVVTDEAGTETTWDVPFAGDATGLVDGSVVIAGARTDGGDAASPAALLLRLWPDGTAAASRYSFSGVVGTQRVTAQGGATISATDDGDWLLEQWPLPGRAEEPPTRPDQTFSNCGSATSSAAGAEQSNGYLFPWTVSGGPTDDDGVFIAVYDSLGRLVIGGGCRNGLDPAQLRSFSGASFRDYGDSLLVALAEPLVVGGVHAAPVWLGDPIVGGEIDSLALEVKVYRVPDDRELPEIDNDNTLLLVQLRGARLTRIRSFGFDINTAPNDAVTPGLDPFDLQTQAPEFVQRYLDALAEGRWEDAVPYIENDGRSWEDRPAFAGLYALVGEDVGTAAALELWCTQERDCTRGVANGAYEQLGETQVNIAVTFEVPGAPPFERTINPLWTVGWFEGGLYVDGLPEVALG